MFDFIIIGAGIVGAATAWQLQQRYPDKKILVLDKESQAAQHQTGHNSGVIHAGVYYPPDSLKARFCREGLRATIDFCREHGIPFEQCSKLIVATNPVELTRMDALFERCQANQLQVEKLTAEQLRHREPAVAGLGAIWVSDTGITDYPQITRTLLNCFQQLGGQVRLDTPVTAIQETSDAVAINTPEATVEGRFVIACAGLMADRLVNMMRIPHDFQIVPFRGEYYRLPERYNNLVNHLIYPVPDPDLPFLGVHLTRMIDGSVTVGPNAVLGWKREGYGRWNFNARDAAQMLSFPGFWRTLGRNLGSGIREMRDSLWRSGYLKQVQKYCPQVELADLQPYPAGIRAQAVMRNGDLVHDFLFAESRRSLHVCNAPSPAATSAIPIGGYICDEVGERMVD